MKNKFKLCCLVLVLGCCFLFRTVSAYAWTTDSLSVSDIVVRDGVLYSFGLNFNVPSNLGRATGWVSIQTKEFDAGNPDEYDYGDLTNFGSIYDRDYDDISDLKRDDDFIFQYGIVTFNDESFDCFGEYSEINTQVTLSASTFLNENQKYYVYLWTQSGDHFYPDTLIGTLELKDEKLIINDNDNQEIVNENIDNLEATRIDKIEITDSNIELTVGEKPSFSAKIKDNADNFIINETFMAINRESTISSDDDPNELVKNYKYYYIIEIDVKNNVNLKFDENTKVYVNGVEKQMAYVSSLGEKISISNENDLIIPVNYIEPAELDAEFAEKQKEELEKKLLQAVRDGKVKYYNDETQNLINQALENNKEILIEVEISKAYDRGLAENYMDEEAINSFDDKIGQNQKIAAYYYVELLVYVDGFYIDNISELQEPIAVTIPMPNGMPQSASGFKRIWNVIRHHDGNTDLLVASKNVNGITYENNKFSIFALIYSDIEDDTIVNEVKNPKTGDGIESWLNLAQISIIGIVGIYVVSKKIR